MKTKQLMFAAALVLTGQVAVAQVLTVAGVERLAIPAGEMTGQVAGIAPDGSFLLLTSATQKGLVKWDLATGSAVTLTDAPAAGFEPTVSADGSAVTYREISVGSDRLVRTSVKRADLARGGSAKTLVKPTRDLLSVSTQMRKDATEQQGPAKGAYRASAKQRAQLLSDGLKLKLVRDGKTTDFAPQGTATTYIWASVSPDGTKALYFCGDLGCAYVVPVAGGLPQELGNLHAAKWLDDYTIVGMEDEDDGMRTTRSRLVAVSLDGRRQVLTDESVPAMWPHASADGTKIVFSTPSGEAYLIHVNR